MTCTCHRDIIRIIISTIFLNEETESIMNDETTKSNENVLVFKRAHIYPFLILLALVTGLSIGYLLWGRDSQSINVAQAVPSTSIAQEGETDEETVPTQKTVKRYDVSEDDDPSIGPSDAPITIIAFSDYECGYCQRWHKEVFPKIREEYADQVRVVYRDFPLYSIHPNASLAAETANCAAEQDAFWEYQDELFSGGDLNQDSYLEYAKKLKLDLDEFEECLDSERYQDEVMADYQYASALGVSSTPTFFLNGLPIVGAQPFEIFKSIIDRELAGEIP
jgi:protein-disulfide isomerase